MRYRNTQTGIEIVSDCVISGNGWEKVEEPSPVSSVKKQPKKSRKKAKE